MPTDIINSVTSAIGSFFDNEVVQFGLRAAAIYVVVLWLAGAYWAFRDMQARSENPIVPYLASALIILFTPILFPFAIIVYRIVRPQERLGEIYERNLAEEALLAEIEAVKSCPSCGRRIHEEWIICPTCRTRLHRLCPSCNRLVGLDWSLCAWCGRDFERRDVVAVPEPLPERLSAEATPAAEAPAARAAARGSGGPRAVRRETSDAAAPGH